MQLTIICLMIKPLKSEVHDQVLQNNNRLTQIILMFNITMLLVKICMCHILSSKEEIALLLFFFVIMSFFLVFEMYFQFLAVGVVF